MPLEVNGSYSDVTISTLATYVTLFNIMPIKCFFVSTFKTNGQTMHKVSVTQTPPARNNSSQDNGGKSSMISFPTNTNVVYKALVIINCPNDRVTGRLVKRFNSTKYNTTSEIKKAQTVATAIPSSPHNKPNYNDKVTLTIAPIILTSDIN